MKKLALLAALPLLLSACAIPTAVVVYAAADSVTFLSSGKSIPSHTLTAAAEKDCSILYGITRGKFCKEKEKFHDNAGNDAGFVVPKDGPALTVNMITPAAVSTSTEVKAVPEPRFFDFDYEAPPAIEVMAGSKSEGMPPPAANRPEAGQRQWALVLGSFADYRSAVELARQVKPEPGLLTAIMVEGKVHYRVSTGPLKRDQAAGRQLNIAALKLETVKLMPVCPAWVEEDNCVALDRALAVQQATTLP
ncbi:MAG: hypothetical protein O3C34_06880 [Proteobacteria bacterium]|nr:hypothetical protein [Pseudomonadota bacterium]